MAGTMGRTPISRRRFVALAVVALAACRGAAASPTAEDAAHAPAESAKPERGLVPSFGPTYRMDSRVVNLADPGRFLRFTVSIEFAVQEEKKSAVPTNQLALYVPEEDAPDVVEVAESTVDPEKLFQDRIKKYTPAIDDAVLSAVSTHTSEELAAPEGRELLKKEIAVRVQRLLGTSERITNVYFSEFAVQ